MNPKPNRKAKIRQRTLMRPAGFMLRAARLERSRSLSMSWRKRRRNRSGAESIAISMFGECVVAKPCCTALRMTAIFLEGAAHAVGQQTRSLRIIGRTLRIWNQ